MNAAAAIVADIRRAIELLADSADPAATRTAAALDRWIRGETFEQSLDLPTDWRMRLRISARDAALRSLIALHPELHDEGLAERIVAGARRNNRTAVRPDGESANGGLLEMTRFSTFRQMLLGLAATTFLIFAATGRADAAITFVQQKQAQNKSSASVALTAANVAVGDLIIVVVLDRNAVVGTLTPATFYR